MTTNYPGALDTTTELKNDAVDATVSLVTHTAAHNNAADALVAIETELGLLPKGSFADVTARLAAMIVKTPGANQVVQPGGDFIAMGLRAHASQVVNLFQVRSSGGTPVLTWDKLANIDAASYSVNGSPLESTHLADTANILKNSSPSITTPTITTPTFTGVPTAPTAPVDDNTTKIATTAFVINQGYARAASPAFTGTPTAPTQSVSDDSTKVATTAYVISQIDNLAVSGIPIGAITPYAGSTAPTGWEFCDGTAISRTTYSELFALVGTTYGVGDGSTTFNLPNMRGRFIVGKGTHADVDTLGENDGIAVANRTPTHAHTNSLTGSSSGGHTHSGNLTSTGSHSHSTTGSSSSGGAGSGAAPNAANSAGVTTSSDGSHAHSGSTGSSGTGNHSVSGTIGVSGTTDQPPFLVVRYIIKVL